MPDQAPPFAASVFRGGRLPASPSQLERVTSAIGEMMAVVPPVWPLDDYVAVNPFLGLAPARFLEARQMLRDVRDCEMLLPAAHFQALYDRGEILAADLEQAFRQCLEAYPDDYTGGDPWRLVRIVAELASVEAGGQSVPPASAERRYFTVSERIDQRLGSSWSSHVSTDISRHCGLHFDRGQAAWRSPWKHLPLYESWREQARISHRMEMLGVTGFRRLVEGLPIEPDQAVAVLLAELGVPERHWQPFLLAEIFSVPGWASYLRYRLWETTLADGATIDDDLIGLLAMRLTYDVGLGGLHPEIVAAAGSLYPAAAEANDRPPPSEGVLGRYLFQVAAEVAYRRRLCSQLIAQSKAASPPGHAAVPSETATPARPTLQGIFCIDVRSEVFRRHLEAASPAVQTFGFAGFFGMPIEYIPLGAAHGPAHCPVLLRPGIQVREQIAADALGTAAAAAARQSLRLGRKVWKTFQTSATSCFSFVESLGLAYLPKLLTDSLGLTPPVLPASCDGVPGPLRTRLRPTVTSGQSPLPLEQRIDLAAGMLTNLGLLDGFARIVLVCGHGSEMVNNPYRAGYDCGACGGHSGEPNARIAASLLNAPEVRRGLAARGIDIPADTGFVAAVHITTTDEVRLLDTAGLTASHAEELAAVKQWLASASEATRRERAQRLGVSTSCEGATAAVLRRSRDWSEVRPEWGLAGNAAFIVAPRSRSLGLDLGGRTFLHDYDHARDPEAKVLELIMTAPLVVTSWINLQYYASAVDNRAFGSGNKLIHNVTGQFGVLLGNGGDLMTGLPWQAVSDGKRLVHEPLRLTVIIEAPRSAVAQVIEKHQSVAQLVENGWVSLLVREADTFYRHTADGWRGISEVAASGLEPETPGL